MTWRNERWKTADDREELELEFDWDEDLEMPFYKGKREVEVGISFDLTQIGQDGIEKLLEAERLLAELGITFDTGYGNGVRDWEWDWSLKGPVKITFRRFADQYLKNRYWRESSAGQAEMRKDHEVELFARVAHTLKLVGVDGFTLA